MISPLPRPPSRQLSRNNEIRLQTPQPDSYAPLIHRIGFKLNRFEYRYSRFSLVRTDPFLLQFLELISQVIAMTIGGDRSQRWRIDEFSWHLLIYYLRFSYSWDSTICRDGMNHTRDKDSGPSYSIEIVDGLRKYPVPKGRTIPAMEWKKRKENEGGGRGVGGKIGTRRN